MQNTFDFHNISSNENSIDDNTVPSYLDAPMSDEDYDFLAQSSEQNAVDQFQSSLVGDFPTKQPANLVIPASDAKDELDQDVKKISIQRNKSEANLNDAKVKLIEGAETLRILAQKSQFRAKARFTRGAETKRALAQASQSRAQASQSHAQARFIKGAETKRALAQASQSRAQARFVSGVETARAQAQSVSFYAQAQHYQAQAQQSQAQASFIAGPQTHQTLSAAAEHWARVEFTQGAQTKRTLAESKKLDMDRLVALTQMIMQGAVIITLIIIFSVYFLL